MLGETSTPPWNPPLLWLIVLFLPHWPCLGRTLWVTPCHNQTTLIFRVEKWIQDCHPCHAFKRTLEEAQSPFATTHHQSQDHMPNNKSFTWHTHTHTRYHSALELQMPNSACHSQKHLIYLIGHCASIPVHWNLLWASLFMRKCLRTLHKVMWGIVTMKCELQGYIEFANNSIGIIDAAHEIHGW